MSKEMYEKISSDFIFAIDLVMNQYQTSNPIIIAEKLEQDLGIDYSIHAIADYLDINKLNSKKLNKVNN